MIPHHGPYLYAKLNVEKKINVNFLIQNLEKPMNHAQNVSPVGFGQ